MSHTVPYLNTKKAIDNYRSALHEIEHIKVIKRSTTTYIKISSSQENNTNSAHTSSK